jgi:hypothetical protein
MHLCIDITHPRNYDLMVLLPLLHGRRCAGYANGRSEVGDIEVMVLPAAGMEIEITRSLPGKG